MELGKAFTFAFDDIDWPKKLLIGLGVIYAASVLSVFTLYLPYVAMTIVLRGWQYEIVKRMRDNHPEPLPNWDILNQARAGFPIAMARTILALPALTLLLVVFVLTYMLVFGLITVLASENVFVEPIIVFVGIVGGVILISALVAIATALGLAGSLIFLGGYIRYSEDEQFSRFFQVAKNLIRLWQDRQDTLVVVLYQEGILRLLVILMAYIPGAAMMLPLLDAFVAGHLIGQCLQLTPKSLLPDATQAALQ